MHKNAMAVERNILVKSYVFCTLKKVEWKFYSNMKKAVKVGWGGYLALNSHLTHSELTSKMHLTPPQVA